MRGLGWFGAAGTIELLATDLHNFFTSRISTTLMSRSLILHSRRYSIPSQIPQLSPSRKLMADQLELEDYYPWTRSTITQPSHASPPTDARSVQFSLSLVSFLPVSLSSHNDYELLPTTTAF
ncbi:hypothetical protein BYT27DRAFT_7248665 [Phlegmacium glaucopus]|nr:hypothetical protein BYT27DRAFT_7248665 [Phlegmacium glaucopus]